MLEDARARGVTAVVCGSDATDHASEYIDHGAGWVIVGEGEATLSELLEALDGRSATPASRITGLTFRSGPDLVTTGHRPNITDLDPLPFPAWDLVDVDRYRDAWRRHGRFSMNLVSTRGCPFHCNWCAKPIWGQRYNSRSPENVVAEMNWLKARYHPDHLWFADDILGLKPGWIERFAKLLRQASAVWIGAESGSQKILDAMDKGDTVQDIYRAAARLRAHGIAVGFFLQFGYPGEGWDDIQLTLKMVRECLPDDIGISVSYPLPGTKFFERVRLELGQKQNWIDSNDLELLYRGPFPDGFYRLLHGRVHHEFRLRRAWAARDWPRLVRAPYHLLRWLQADVRLRALAGI
jgi:radical SAM superfamily enzyme YgiQ (UPF0313 family)